ncbi:hypothetical protein [Psychrobacter sp. ANT_WB68]|uniref:hypothetical protein n=1 Tax=Psychrobacter sp. ANT_WB68 TaxID=2597355 RepID=UPI0011F26EC5|nr:hypothetical protein [Psychrobacter sp. ANT_WB68]KAA0914470.1 hypothetical protein FQ084_07840 [Psychrobacter sp. ANT_WB68]
MGQLTSKKRTLAYDSQASVVQSSIICKNHPIKLAIYAFTAASATTILMGCQTNTALPQSSQTPATTIDFSVADSGRNQAQSQAFSSQLNANAEQYQQLFDQSKNPNMETQAKTRLLSAIRQHLAGEHVAVSKANYHSIPFIKAGSIDAGSSSFFRTLLELYLSKNTEIDDYSEYEEAADAIGEDSEMDNATGSYNEEDSAVEVEEAAATEVLSYDEYGYDEYGNSQDSSDDESASDYDNNSDSDYNNRDLSSRIRSMDFRGFLSEYENMQASKAANGTQDDNAARTYPGMLTQLVNMFIRTPQQIEAINNYHYQYLTVNSVSHYKPQQKQLQSVYSYDYVAPTISSSIQLPIALDFNKSALTVDPSALLPILALANPEHAPLPTQMSSHTINFGLPEAISSQIPSAVIYDAVIAALQNSMAELEPEYFSAVDIRDDTFAKQVGANRAIKVYFGSKQSGEMLGKMIKNISRSLQKYIDENPNSYPDDSILKTEIARLELYNKGYQSADVGSLLQLIEAVSPISFNHINYYYLDDSDHLLAKQQRLNIGSDFFGSQNTVLNQTLYDSASFNKHPLMPLLEQSFGAKASAAIDGNAWLAKQRQQKERLEMARDARYDYVEATEAIADYTDYDVTDTADEAISFDDSH